MSLIYEHVFLCQRISQMRAYLGIKMLSTILSRALKKRTRAVFNSTKPLLPVFLSVLVMTPVWADDTEIFFGGGSNSDATPNVLFVIDTSGSMGNNVSGTNDSRITVVKDALTELVSTVNNINVGLMRFSKPGGPVLFAISSVDAREGTDTTTTGTWSGSAESDGDENLSTGAVTLDADLITFGNGVGIGSGSDSGSSGSATFYITGDDDDAVQAYGSNGDGDLEENESLCIGGKFQGNNCKKEDDQDDDQNWLLGLLFRLPATPAGPPPGATITGAWVELLVDKAKKDDLVVDVYAEAPNAPDFDDEDIYGRTRVAGPIPWDMDDGSGDEPSDGQRIQSPDIKSLVQAAVNNQNWSASNGGDLAIIMELDFNATEEDAYREFESADTVGNDWDEAPRLSLLWEVPAVSTSADYLSAIRFADVGVPQGATVTNGTLTITPTGTAEADVVLTIALDAATDAAVLAAETNNLSGRSSGTSLNVTVPAAQWQDGTPVDINVASLLDTQVKTTNWCSGNVVFLIESANAAHYIATTETQYDPQLNIDYDTAGVAAGSSCLSTTLSKQIIVEADDAKVKLKNNGQDKIETNKNDFKIKTNNNERAVFRFQDLGLPQNETITAAYLELTAEDDKSGNAVLAIAIEETANSAALQNSNSFNRDFTDASARVAWTINEDWQEDSTYRSPNIASLIESVIDLGGWSSGNALTIEVSASSGSERKVYGYKKEPLKAARLIIEYQGDGSSEEEVEGVRNEFLETVDSLGANGWTPIQDTLYEAYLYYTGGAVKWGLERGDGPYEYTRTSVEAAITPASFSGNTIPSGCPGVDSNDSDCKNEVLNGSPIYQSPIASECQGESHIVFLTDGEPTHDSSTNFIKQAIGTNSCTNYGDHKDCVVELAGYMHDNDLAPSLPGIQRVTTHMVGFDFNSSWLESIAQAGGGEYKTANDLDSLVTEFRSIVSGVLRTNTSFVAPVAAVNQYNQLTTLDDVYFAVFQPDDKPRWSGNLKRYRLGDYGGETNAVLDANGFPVADAATGFFKDTAQSYWSSGVDGADVTLGGSAEQINSYSTRLMFTDIAGAELSAAGNRISTTNSAALSSALGVSDSQARNDLIEWIQGRDVDNEDNDDSTDTRFVMSDPLHSEPVAINYGSGNTEDVTVFFGTNTGVLHAINGATGAEVFSYIPQDLLGMQQTLRDNTAGNAHVYGLDGSPAIWSRDQGQDGFGNNVSGDFVRLFIGQRRGGSNYYGLDITNRATPSLLWKLEGGSGDFSEMGQSWAQPIPGRIKIGSAVRDVLFISGGYDTGKDGSTTSSTDTKGRALYIVDAETGQKLWSGGPTIGQFDEVFSDMQYSIPAALAVIDANRDGLSDGMYVGDLGGQVWRFDITNGASIGDLVTGGVIADLGAAGSSDAAQNRRFYHSPDVAILQQDGERVLAITIGSGERPSPLRTTVNDRFYTLFQTPVFGRPDTYTALRDRDDPSTGTVEDPDLLDVSAYLQGVDSADAQVVQLTLADKEGWYVDLPGTGEKVISSPTIFRGVVLFSAYQPTVQNDSCQAQVGTSRVYQLSLGEGLPKDITAPLAEFLTEVPTPVNVSGITSITLMNPEGGPTLLTGSTSQSLPDLGIRINYWRQDK